MKQSFPIGRALRAALLVLLLNALGMTNVFADGYDYAEECPSGQTLYYKNDPNDPNAVIVVAPYYYYFYEGHHYEFWQGYERPSGDLVIPETLSNGRVVKSIGITEIIVQNGPYSNEPHYCSAFGNCTGLTSVTIPNTVVFVDDLAFSGCSGLTEVTIGNAVKRFGRDEDSYHSSGRCFSGCTSLTTVHFGNSVEFLGAGMFMGCSKLASLTLPNSLLGIDDEAFVDCVNLSSLSIPNSVSYLGSNLLEGSGWYNAQSDGMLYLDGWCLGYKGDTHPENLIIQDGTKGIAEFAFAEGKKDRGVVSVTLPQSLKYLCDAAFMCCRDLVSVTLPNALISIGNNAFDECKSIASVTIPKNVTKIGGYAFRGCSHLTMVYYNAEDATCGVNVLAACNSLASLHIGADVKKIDGNAFKKCNTVHLVTALGPTPAMVEPDAFSEIADDAVLCVSCGKKITYLSAWTSFPYDKIVENCDQLPISMGNVGAGGTITPSSTTAQMGEEVLLTVTPNAGMALASITIHNASDPTQTIPYYFPGKAKTTVGFIMPSFAVSVTATFKTSGASVAEDGMEVAVYPNPTNGEVRVEVDGMRNISVFNLLGQQIFNAEATGNVFELDFSGYEPGIYLVRIETESGVATKQVVLKK